MSIKKIYLITLLCLMANVLKAQMRFDQSTPRKTLETVFRCARTGIFDNIHLLCDPEQRNDGDTKRICSLATSGTKEQRDFRRFFKLAYSLVETITQEKSATVTFKFGPRAQQNETMYLIKRDDKWYLSSF